MARLLIKGFGRTGIALVALCTLLLAEGGVTMAQEMTEKVEKSEAVWQETLTPEQFRILRQKGTEPPFTGTYYHHHEEGIYVCAGCGNVLFDSAHKYDSGSGWPSFWQPARKTSVATGIDQSLLMVREEVQCARCGGHLGHVFDDGPPPTGRRYCINSGALDFVPREKGE